MQIKKWLKRSLILIPIAIGVVAVVVVAPKMKKPPQKVEAVESATKVRVIKPLFQEVSPKALGYGSTAPIQSWSATAEVSGRIEWLSDNLKTGNIISKGSKLLKINDSEYKLALSQVNAQFNISKVKESTTKKSLAVEHRNRISLKKEVIRQKSLKQKGLLPASSLEAAERSLIKADATIQTLKNALSIISAEREVLIVQREQANLELKKTTITAPFDVRIVSISAQEAHFANKGQALFSADATDKTEIEARFPIGQLRPLIASKEDSNSQGVIGLDAIVRLKTSSHTIEWKAKVERSAGLIDRQTQTTGIIVSVDDPYGKAKPGQRPPLVRNTFVEVELHGKPKGKQIIIPTSAIHEGKIYVASEENRLVIRKIKIAFTQGRYAVLVGGLKPNEKIIVTDLIPPVPDMLLKTVDDKKTRGMLMMEVSGKPMTPKESNTKEKVPSDKKESAE